MSLFQLEFTCGDKSFREQRNTDDPPPTHNEIRAMVNDSCSLLGFNTPEDMKGQEITVRLIPEDDPDFLVMEAA